MSAKTQHLTRSERQQLRRPPKPWRIMNEREVAAVLALQRVTYPIGAASKRFAHNLAAQLADLRITDLQAAYLWKVAYTFRRQLPSDVVAYATEAHSRLIPSEVA